MKALVIGATGIIGNHVVRSLLDEGIDVRAFSRGVTPSLNLQGLSVEISKAKDELGYYPSPVEPCLERAVHWFKTIGYC